MREGPALLGFQGTNRQIGNFISIPAIILFLAVTRLVGQEIREEQVHFDKGSNGTMIAGSIAGSETVDYLINAREGQVMHVGMDTDNTANYFNIMEPGEDYVAIYNSAMAENNYSGTLSKNGDYKIRVYLMRSAARRNEKANFQLEVSITGNVTSSLQDDALVAGTDYHATGQIPCRIGGNGQPTGNCEFGVKRLGNGSGSVIITRPDGMRRVIIFENGKVVGHDSIEISKGEINVTRDSDLYIITIGDEHYEIPEAVIYGG